MTRLIRHIEDLGVDEWATLTRRAAVEAVAAAERRGKKPPAELVAVAAMTERQLVERRARNGPARQRLSPVMQLVEADHLRRVAEARAREAHQHKLDAEAAATAARAEAEQSARTADAARAELRTVQQQSAERDRERAAERAAAAAAHEQGVQQVRAEFEQVRADAETEVAASRERAMAAEARAQQRVTERTAATEAAEKAVQQLRGEFEQVRADAEAVVAAARERATAADARAHQRAAERTAATEAAENVAQQLRGKLERVRADADAEVAASRGWAAGEAAAVRKAADADVARAYAAADDAIRQAEAKAARAKSLQPLSIPVPSFEFRAETGHIENALNAIQRIDYVLEVDMVHEGDTDIPLDVELMQTLAWIVQEHAAYLSNESQSATSAARPHPLPSEAAAAYEEAATAAFRAMLRRIEVTARRLRGRQRSPDAEVVNIVTGMLADPWVQRAIS
jgi:vacuolar-type H+-ATPase subunit I/STV1